jgi:16S rRNA (guanine(966)-N(2))-methyltransferase RsmD
LTTKSSRNTVRIIGGKWKRSLLRFSDADGLRPTPDRVRETVFNWLGQDLSGLRVLDAFTGTGAMALESASRGAAQIVALDTHPKAVRTVQAHAQRLGADQGFVVHHADALQFMKSSGGTFDLVFLDPPFAANLYVALESAVGHVLSEHGRVYVESPAEFATFADLIRVKHLRAGAVHAHVFARARQVAP